VIVATATYPNKYSKAAATRKANNSARYQRIRLRFNELYHADRKRIDDVIVLLQHEFCLTKRTLETVLKDREAETKKPVASQQALVFG
jgi:hypothetical protein